MYVYIVFKLFHYLGQRQANFWWYFLWFRSGGAESHLVSSTCFLCLLDSSSFGCGDMRHNTLDVAHLFDQFPPLVLEGGPQGCATEGKQTSLMSSSIFNKNRLCSCARKGRPQTHTHLSSASLKASICLSASVFRSCSASAFSLSSFMTPGSTTLARRGSKALSSISPAVKVSSREEISSRSRTQSVWLSSSTPELALWSTDAAESSHVCMHCRDKWYLWTRARA